MLIISIIDEVYSEWDGNGGSHLPPSLYVLLKRLNGHRVASCSTLVIMLIDDLCPITSWHLLLLDCRISKMFIV